MRSDSAITSSMRWVMKRMRHALSREFAHQLEHRRAVGEIERGGDLVEDQDAGIAHHRAGQHHQLLGGQRQMPGWQIERHLGAGEARKHSGSAVATLAARNVAL